VTTRRAVVSYPVGASRDEKIVALKDGLTAIAVELAELGVPLEAIDAALENALETAEFELEQ
jgi:hypothetical protein